MFLLQQLYKQLLTIKVFILPSDLSCHFDFISKNIFIFSIDFQKREKDYIFITLEDVILVGPLFKN